MFAAFINIIIRSGIVVVFKRRIRSLFRFGRKAYVKNMPGSLWERPSSLLPRTCFSLPLLFRTPATRLSEKDTTVTLSRVNRMTARPARRSMQGYPYHYYSAYSFSLYLPKGLDPLVNISSPLTVPYNGIPPIPPINEQSPNCKLLRPSERENSKLV